MEKEYRIKQVNIPLNDGELIIFYPQMKKTKEVTTGYLWWKKIIKEYDWTSFYKYDDNDIQPFQITSGRIVNCDTLEEAQNILDNYEKKRNDSIRESYKKSGADWIDERYIKIHEIKK